MERTLFRRKTISLREAGFIGYWQNKDQSPSVLIDINNFLCQFRLVSHLSVIYTNIFSLSKGITIITNQYFSVSENSQVLILRFCLRLLNSNLDSDCFPLLLCNQYPLVFISFVYLKYCRYSHFLPLSCPHLFSHHLLRRNCLIESRRLQMHTSVICHIYIALSVRHPELSSPCEISCPDHP